MAEYPLIPDNERVENDFTFFTLNSNNNYITALNEIKDGHKVSHWIWYVFPQLEILGYSSNAKYFGLKSVDEAKNYINDKRLGLRLVEISREALFKLNRDIKITTLMGDGPDPEKLLSCVTLFYFATLGTHNNLLFESLMNICKKQLDKEDTKTENFCNGVCESSSGSSSESESLDDCS